ncbi:MAG: hypothetical protein ACRDJN_19010, partial [Chloroflexota bacterium]
MGLLDELLASARDAPPLVAIQAAVGPRFTAVVAAPEAGAARTTTGGVAYTDAADLLPGFDATAATAALQAAIQGRPLLGIMRDVAPESADGEAALSASVPARGARLMRRAA